MQLRRGLIAFALVLAAVSFGAALSTPREEDEAAPPAPTSTTTTAPGTVNTTLRQPPPDELQVRRVRTGSHVVLTVSAAVTGNVEVAGLGLLQPVEPGTPAVFDVLASQPGRYTVNLVSLNGERTRLGVLAVG